jgi:hypothetical protein
MDTTTVLEIIKMIDTRLYCIARDYEQQFMRDEEFYSASNELTELQTKLQSYIEAQVTYAENNLGSSE